VLASWGLGVFVVALVWSRGVAQGTTPLGASEEHFAIGQRLYRTHSLAGENDPGVLRPPGYPAFVAATLHLRDAAASLWGRESGRAGADEGAVRLGQSLAVAAAATVIFAFAAALVPPLEAACVGLVLACGPMAIALVGLYSYHALHVLLLAAATAQLAFAARAPGVGTRRVLLSGILWALATLVRPVTLILPPFALLLARLRRGGAWRPAALFALVFTAGMAIPILPWAVRNYSITGRVVPVNVQGGFALWATTAGRPEPPDPFLSWPRLWEQYGMTLYRQVTGDSEYDLAVFSCRVVELEDAFKRQALRNVRRDPSVYLGNVANNLWRFGGDAMGSWASTFAELNYRPGDRARFVLNAHGWGLLLLAAPGLAWGLWRRDASAWTVFLVLVTLAAAHAVTFLNARYTYVKLPLLAMGLALTLQALGDSGLARGRVRVRLAPILAVAALAGSASATLVLLAR
jgi:4-amino-4-deoxy-L-arabinose transferase-like glycosyltransferase